MSDLIVFAPEIVYEAVDPGLAMLEKPLIIRCAAVTGSGGAALGRDRFSAAGFLVYRQTAAGSSLEIWNENAKQWEPDPGGAPADQKPKPFAYQEGETFPWQGLLVAVSQKDAAGLNQFQADTGGSGYPRYSFRAFFASADKGSPTSVTSAPSQSIRFISLMDAIRAGIRVGEGQTPEDATEVHFFLRDSSRRVVGSVEIRADGGSARIEISNRSGAGAKLAVVRLLPAGDVEIQPPAGGKVQVLGALEVDAGLCVHGDVEVGGALEVDGTAKVHGDLEVLGTMETERIHYQPHGAPPGSKQWL